MKKRIFACLLAIVLLALSVPAISASGNLWFIAVNDRIPQTMSAETEPFYISGKLYIPQSAFNVYPFNVVPSYSENKRMLVLFDKNRRLVYDLENKTCTDKDGKSKSCEIVYRDGELFIPAKTVEYFDIKVKLLENEDGYYVLRFYDGTQVYDDQEFLKQARQLIDHQTGSQDIDQHGDEEQLLPEMPQENDVGETGGVTYPVLLGAAVSEDTYLALEEFGVKGAFFLTAEQITDHAKLVRCLLAGGHTVGLTVATGENDVQGALDRANTALDTVALCKTLFAVLPAGTEESPRGYRLLDASYATRMVDEIPVLTVLTGTDAAYVIGQLVRDDIQLLQLRISTPIS